MAPFFTVCVLGELECAQLPYFDNVYCKIAFTHGLDWSVISGLREGITQIARSSVSRQLFISHADISKTCVWNFPIEITFKSHNPYGWPQIVFSLYGLDEFGRDVVRGYGAARVPVVPGRHTLYVDVYTPVATSPFNELLSWIRGKAPEFLDPTFVTKNSSREVTRVRSQGTVKLKLNVIVKDFDQLGYSSC